MRIGSLCSGIGGLELGLERAGLGRTAWQCEYDPHASEVLARHWDVPNHGDVKLTDWTAVEQVDVICAGYPCQPFSTAGRRQGTDDDRHLWPFVRDAIRDVGPRLVVLENVRGHLSLGFGDVLGGLADLGFDAGWCLLRASDVGAPHQRARLFVAAHATGRSRPNVTGEPDEGRPLVSAGTGASGGDGEGGATEGVRGLVGGAGMAQPASPDATGVDDAWPIGGGSGGGRPQHQDRDGHRIAGSGDAAADADGAGVEARGADPVRTEALQGGRAGRLQPVGGGPDAVRWGPYGPAITRWEHVHGPAPAPTTDGRLSPRFVEWMMGFPEGWVDGLTRTAALRCLGNAVVPQVAERFGRMVAGDREPVAA